MKNIFSDILKGKVVIVGIGNSLRADDAFGCLFVERIKDDTSFVCFDVGTSLENYAGKIIKEKPDTILFVDATHLGLEPGETKILEASDIVSSGLTTHDLSPKMFLDYLQSQTKASMYLLAVQPATLSMGEEMSEKLKGVLGELLTLIAEAEYARNAHN